MSDFMMFCVGFEMGLSTLLFLDGNTLLASITFFLGAFMFFLDTIKGAESE